jgi:RNA polymerase sigma-70 factor, ECF subfamily
MRTTIDRQRPKSEQAGQAEECRTADSACFAEIVKRTEPALRRLLGRLCGRHADLDDLVQETYLRVWRGFGRFRGESSLTTWMTRIAVNVSRNWARSRRPTVALSECAESVLGLAPEAREAAVFNAYEQALARLSPEQRAVFILHEAEGMSYQEIAMALGCPVGTVMSRLHRARTRLLDDLRERIEELVP